MEKLDTVRSFLAQITSDNEHHMRTISKDEYKGFAKVQSPRATVVMCSDSRVQTKALSMMDVNDLFVIRNIGNQVINASGSIEFGIRFLKTPVLIIIGHSGCGAVETVVNNIDTENPCIERELEPIDVDGKCLNDAIIQNVNNQVKMALKKFKYLVSDEELVVIGAVYDFQNAFKRGLGRLIVTNVNGEINPSEILKTKYFSEMTDVATMPV